MTWGFRKRTPMVYSIMQEPSSLCGLAGTTSFHVSLVQQCTDLARQFNRKKWLFQVAGVLREVRCPADCVFRVARDEQEPHIWPQQTSPFSLGIMISLTTRSISPGLFSKIR